VLFRFEAHAYYWGLCFLARSTAVSVITLLPSPFVQLQLLSVVMVVYLVALCLVWPWKAPVVNALDALQTTLLLVILLAATRLVGTDNGGEDSDAVTGIISTCYVVLLVAFGIAGVLVLRGKLDMGDKTGSDSVPEKDGAEKGAKEEADKEEKPEADKEAAGAEGHDAGAEGNVAEADTEEKPEDEAADGKENADDNRVKIATQI